MHYLMVIGIFLTVVLLIQGGYLACRALYAPERRRVRRRLHTLTVQGHDDTSVEIVRRRALSEVAWVNDLLVKIPLIQRLGRLLEQANSRFKVGTFLGFSAALGCLGFLVGPVVVRNVYGQMLGGIVLCLTPWLYVLHQKKRRMQQFEKQLPEALDLVARALQAGHTFMVGIKMVGDEFADPIGTEFDKMLDEINYGVSVPEALQGLSERVDCPDVNLFVTGVILQRETGGNLAEILGKTSQVIRQRFELLGRIRVLSAEGKFSAIVLIVLPFAVSGIIHVLSPNYLPVLFTDPIGHGLMGYGAIMMAIGTLVIRKMIRIRV
jgi:tight adherence protein B